MKKIITIALIAIISPIYSQVGIGTIEPTETLDIDGTLRVRATAPHIGTELVKIGGLDANGVFHEIAIGTNLILKNNTLSVKIPFDHSYGSIHLEGSIYFENVDLKLNEGEENEGKTIIKISFDDPSNRPLPTFDIRSLKIDGIRDGQQIWILCDTREIRFLTTGDPENPPGHILGYAPYNPKVNRNEIVNFVYDGEIKKWRIANNIDKIRTIRKF